MTPEMQYSPKGILLTQEFESCRLLPYKDGGGVWTDGWGNTNNVVPGVCISMEKANADLLNNVQKAVWSVNHYVAIKLKQNEFDALVDFVYNVGTGAFASSTLLRKLNTGDLLGAANEFERWDMDNGKHIAGLLRRRKAEHSKFLGDIV
jgi:lysozyme